MPLSANVPVIDNRRYDEIVTELRTRIPRYTSEWTDFNDSDPGITLLQLFAWLSDMLLYRMGRVPELNYLKFLELLGIQLRAAEPAVAEITFPLLATAAPSVIIPARTQASAEAADSARPVVFETDRAVTAIKAELNAVQAFDGFAFSDVTVANKDAVEGFLPFGTTAGEDSALYLGFDPASPIPKLELDLAIVVAAQGAPKHVSCDLAPASRFASATIRWEYWDGAEWRSLDLLVDETLAFTRSGHVRLRTPKVGLMVPDIFGDIQTPRVWMRARLLRAQYERVPRLLAVRTNTVSATQAQTVRDEVLGGSDGRANQVFRLFNSPVLDGTLQLEVDEGDGFQAWTEVDDFFGAGPQDHVYVLDRTTGDIAFSDGDAGAIPVGNPDRPGSNIVARVYRFGGGTIGNVPAMAINSLLGGIEGVDADNVGNLLAAIGGKAEETLESAKLRAPHSIKSRGRAVTAEDFEQLAIETGPVRRAKALPLSHPDFPGVKVPGVVTVIVVPEAEVPKLTATEEGPRLLPEGTNPKPMPSEGTLRLVCECLDRVRLVTTEVYVRPPVYRLVKVTTDIVVDDRADLAGVKTAIQQALYMYFHPLIGGEDGQGWPFGGDIFYSRVYGRASVIGVQSIERMLISLDGIEAPECTNVPLCAGELAYSVEHDVNVRYAFTS